MNDSTAVIPQLQGKPHCVYLLRESDTDFYKIGKGNDAKARRADLQTGNRQELLIVQIATLDNENMAYALERTLHRSLDDYRVRGEWFELSQDQVEKVQYAMMVATETVRDHGERELSNEVLRRLLDQERRAIARLRERIVDMQIAHSGKRLTLVSPVDDFVSYVEVVHRKIATQYEARRAQRESAEDRE
jgi:hypothetical protein